MPLPTILNALGRQLSMKLKLLVTAIAFILMIAPSLAEDKVDILGVSAGMPAAELQRVIQSSGWQHCGRDSMGFFRCNTGDHGDILFVISDALPDRPVLAIRIFFRSGDTPENVVAAVSKQFGKQPNNQSNGNFRWALSNGSELLLEEGSSYVLTLSSRTLIEANKKAQQEAAAAKNPTPKF
jgi:hypothetical protein